MAGFDAARVRTSDRREQRRWHRETSEATRSNKSKQGNRREESGAESSGIASCKEEEQQGKDRNVVHGTVDGERPEGEPENEAEEKGQNTSSEVPLYKPMPIPQVEEPRTPQSDKQLLVVKTTDSAGKPSPLASPSTLVSPATGAGAGCASPWSSVSSLRGV